MINWTQLDHRREYDPGWTTFRILIFTKRVFHMWVCSRMLVEMFPVWSFKGFTFSFCLLAAVAFWLSRPWKPGALLILIFSWTCDVLMSSPSVCHQARRDVLPVLLSTSGVKRRLESSWRTLLLGTDLELGYYQSVKRGQRTKAIWRPCQSARRTRNDLILENRE